MKKSTLILSLLILVLFQACTTESNTKLLEYTDVNGKQIPIYRFDLVNDSAIDIPLSILFEDVDIVPLETNKDLLIAYGNVLLTEQSVIISTIFRSNPTRILEFDLNGNFIREFGGIGNGPGEHTGNYAYKLKIHPNDNVLQVSIYGDRFEEHEYDLQGNFIRIIHQPFDLTLGPCRLSSDKYFVSGSATGIPKFKKDSFLITFFKPDGTWIDAIPRQIYPAANNNGYIPYGNNSTWQFNNHWYYYTSAYDTLYQISETHLIPRAVCLFGDNHSQAGKFVDPQTEVGRYTLEIIKETDDFIYFKKEHLYKMEAKEYAPGSWSSMSYLNYSTLLWDKNSGKGYNIRFKDDILGLLQRNYYELEINWGEYGTSKFVPTEDLLTWLEEAHASGTIPERAKERIKKLENLIDENSNPLVFLFKERPEEEFTKRIEEFISSKTK